MQGTLSKESESGIDFTVEQLRSDLKLRGLMGEVLRKAKIARPSIAYESVRRAFLYEKYEDASPLSQYILKIGNKLLLDDNVRMAAALAEIEDING